MLEKMSYIISQISLSHINVLFILGLALFGGTAGGRLFEKMKVPQVVAYILVGVILGKSGLRIIDESVLKGLQSLNYFALGLIGFMIGGELKKDVLKKYGRQFVIILFSEGLAAFVTVTVLVGMVGSLIWHDSHLAWGLAVVLGAIASATAPAATTDVLWENKCKGPLTTTIFGIVALDDALALILFTIASSLAQHILGVSHESFLLSLWHPIYEIGGAILIGILGGGILAYTLNKYHERHRVIVILMGTVMFVLGLAMTLKVSMLLAAMVLGVFIVNALPQASKDIFQFLDYFTPPIFVLFFVCIGASFNFQMIDTTGLVLVAVYFCGRTLGKMAGAYGGAKLAGAPTSVARYLPLCLFSQAGVAIGLSIVASQILPESVGNTVVMVVTASTFVVQLIGPSCVKAAVNRAGEVGKNITEEDLIATITVRELMDEHYPIIKSNMKPKEILDAFCQHDHTQFPVVNENNRVTGVININSIRHSLQFLGSDQLFVADDLKQPFRHTVRASSTLKEAKIYMDKFRLGFIPVVNEDSEILGCFDRLMYQRFVSRKMLELKSMTEV